jgi:glutathione S-transferase
MKLYSYRLSGHSHRVRLFLSILDLNFETIEVDLASGAHKSPAYLSINPRGQVPVLVDGELTIPESTAILVYLAKKYDATSWLPESPVEAYKVQRWLSVASGEVAYALSTARKINLFKLPSDPSDLIARSQQLLGLIDEELSGQKWLAGDHATIADVALYAYVARAPEGGIDLSGYNQIRRWLNEVEALPRFVPFASSPLGLNASG